MNTYRYRLGCPRCGATRPARVRPVIVLLFVSIGVYLWLKVLDAIDPETDEPDGESEGEIDPDLPLARAGDILLFNRAKGLNRLITIFTRSPFYHVGISTGNNRVVEARPRGVVVRDLMGRDGDKRFEIIPAERIGGREAALKAMAWAKTKVGEGYDPFNVLSIVLDQMFSCCAFNASLPHHWACGEFVTTAFDEAGIKLFGKAPAAVVPADFEKFLPSEKRGSGESA